MMWNVWFWQETIGINLALAKSYKKETIFMFFRIIVKELEMMLKPYQIMSVKMIFFFWIWIMILKNADYCQILLSDFDSNEAACYFSNPNVELLECSSTVHAVKK